VNRAPVGRSLLDLWYRPNACLSFFGGKRTHAIAVNGRETGPARDTTFQRQNIPLKPLLLLHSAFVNEKKMVRFEARVAAGGIGADGRRVLMEEMLH
jgi:hypothetical protein